jgi:deazaflavin-dependent oxidoreductase (nitroreductase family)
MSREDRDVDAADPLSGAVRAALNHSQIIDLTTKGRRTGQLRRIEIFLHSQEGQLFISGMPRVGRTRDWIYNIAADPHVVVHLKQSVTADVPATARVVTDPDERRPLIEAAAKRWGRTDVTDMLRHSPLIVLNIDAGASA